MKLQYLGDSKDSFKWDYHHFLMEALNYSSLQIVWMMTPDDGGPDGRSAPELFPARTEILQLCHQLRSTRDPALILDLPTAGRTSYTVSIHQTEEVAANDRQRCFFSGVETTPKQVTFLDPDNGFEPESSASDKHVQYANLDRLINAMPPESVVTVFQHHRRKKFPTDFARIRERLISGYSCAIYWRSLMFVCVSRSQDVIGRVREIHLEYAQHRPVHVLAGTP